MQEINDLKIKIFDIIRQQELFAAQSNQLEQAKRTLVTKLQQLEQASIDKPAEVIAETT